MKQLAETFKVFEKIIPTVWHRGRKTAFSSTGVADVWNHKKNSRGKEKKKIEIKCSKISYLK